MGVASVTRRCKFIPNKSVAVSAFVVAAVFYRAGVKYMGTWGAGNFDNDSASDYIQDFCVPVMDQIRRHMSDENLMEVCEPDEDFSFANMEIMIRLADIYGFCEYADSEEQARIAEIAAWKTKYLNHYDQ
ncbi:MAG: hypothetical protein H8F28_21185, partial [Fibrella sp.]|nr:hypothetical protein [Armatimonadota bacterium]